MASNLRVDSIVPATGSSVSIGTATGGVSIPGVLTYEDVTNVDSIGVITARSGINITGGRLLLGTTTEGFSEYDDLTIATSGHTGITIRSGASNEGTIAFSDGTSGADEYRGLVQYNHTNNYLRFLTDATERLRITSDGNALVGTTNATTIGTVNRNLIVGSTTNAEEVGLTLNVMEGTNNRRVKFFLDDDDGVFGIDSTASTGVAPFVVRMATSEKLRITSDGYVTKPNTPAFHVSRQGGDVSANNYVTFDHADYNNGSHYNTSDGKFTAPVTGIYFFSAWHFTGGTSAFYLRINGTTFGEYTWDDTGGCGTWVCPMTANQYAQIYTKYTWRGTSDYHNAFCGYLIG